MQLLSNQKTKLIQLILEHAVRLDYIVDLNRDQFGQTRQSKLQGMSAGELYLDFKRDIKLEMYHMQT